MQYILSITLCLLSLAFVGLLPILVGVMIQILAQRKTIPMIVHYFIAILITLALWVGWKYTFITLFGSPALSIGISIIFVDAFMTIGSRIVLKFRERFNNERAEQSH